MRRISRRFLLSVAAVGTALSMMVLTSLPAYSENASVLDSSEVAVATPAGFPTGTDVRTLRRAARKVTAKASGLSSVCSSTTPLTALLIKAEISHHISPGDVRAQGYTLIFGKGSVQLPASFYYCDGSLAGKFGYYGRWNVTGRPRAYGGAGGVPPHSVSAIRAIARRKSCGSNLYLATTSRAPTACLSWNAGASRTGSPY